MDDCGCPRSTSKLPQYYFCEGMSCHSVLCLSCPSFMVLPCEFLVTIVGFVCVPLYLMSHWYFYSFFLCVFGFSVPIFFQWFLLPTMWMSLSVLLLGVLWLVFISCSTGQAAGPPLWSWVLQVCIQLDKDHQLSLPWQPGGRLQEQDLYQGGSPM